MSVTFSDTITRLHHRALFCIFSLCLFVAPFFPVHNKFAIIYYLFVSVVAGASSINLIPLDEFLRLCKSRTIKYINQ